MELRHSVSLNLNLPLGGASKEVIVRRGKWINIYIKVPSTLSTETRICVLRECRCLEPHLVMELQDVACPHDIYFNALCDSNHNCLRTGACGCLVHFASPLVPVYYTQPVWISFKFPFGCEETQKYKYVDACVSSVVTLKSEFHNTQGKVQSSI